MPNHLPPTLESLIDRITAGFPPHIDQRSWKIQWFKPEALVTALDECSVPPDQIEAVIARVVAQKWLRLHPTSGEYVITTTGEQAYHDTRDFSLLTASGRKRASKATRTSRDATEEAAAE